MRDTLCRLIFFLFPLSLLATSPQGVSDEESLHVRRIALLVEEGELTLAKREMTQFGESFPESQYIDRFWTMQGDMAYREGDHELALKAYGQVKAEDLLKRSLEHRLHSLVATEQYDLALQVASPFLLDQEAAIFYSAEAHYLLQQNESADRLYAQLADTSFQQPAMVRQAEILVRQQHYAHAFKVYLQLSRQYPEQAEAFMLQAAMVQSKVDAEGALDTLKNVVSMHGNLTAEATWLEVVLLSELQQYSEFLERQEVFQEQLAPDKKSLLGYYTARAHAGLNDPEQALNYLHPFIESEETDPGYHQAAILLGVTTAGSVGKAKQVDRWVELFEQKYSDEPELGQALFLQAMSHKKNGNQEKALALLDRLSQEFSTFIRIEDVQFERSALLYEMGCSSDARDGFAAFTESFPESRYRGAVFQYMVANSLKEFDQSEDEERRVILAERIEKDIQALFGSEKQPQYMIQLAKVFYKLKRYERAQNRLSDFFSQYESHPKVAEAHYLMALCHYEGDRDYTALLLHGEAALAANPDLKEGGKLHAALFTGAMALAKEKSEDPVAQTALFDQASRHLYHAFERNPDGIDPKHSLWAANQLVKGLPLEADGVLVDASKLVGDEREKANQAMRLLRDGSQNTQAALLLARLTDGFGKHVEAFDLLVSLGRLNNKDKALKRYMKGRLLQKLGRFDEALVELDKVLKHPVRQPALVASARLQWARLTAAKDTSPAVLEAVLQVLKGVQVRRVLEQEPIHLEAGIERAQLLAKLAAPEEKISVWKEALKELKNDYSATGDISSKDYHSRRKKLPEKELVYQAYMVYIDAELSFLSSLLNDQSSSGRRIEAAESIYKTLTQGKFAVSKYLKDQAELRLQAICDPLSEAEQVR